MAARSKAEFIEHEYALIECICSSSPSPAITFMRYQNCGAIAFIGIINKYAIFLKLTNLLTPISRPGPICRDLSMILKIKPEAIFPSKN